MSEHEPTKVILRRDIPEKLADHLANTTSAVAMFMISKAVAEARYKALRDARAYLAQQGRDQDLLNVYMDLDRSDEKMVITLTFSNPDTALMFRLAVL